MLISGKQRLISAVHETVIDYHPPTVHVYRPSVSTVLTPGSFERLPRVPRRCLAATAAPSRTHSFDLIDASGLQINDFIGFPYRRESAVGHWLRKFLFDRRLEWFVRVSRHAATVIRVVCVGNVGNVNASESGKVLSLGQGSCPPITPKRRVRQVSSGEVAHNNEAHILQQSVKVYACPAMRRSSIQLRQIMFLSDTLLMQVV